jgi:hypothetical protein
MRPPRIGGALQRRQDGHEPWVIDLSCAHTDACTPAGGTCARSAAAGGFAAARELAHYCWELAVT